MHKPDLHLSAAEAARELGVSAKALRLYERRGLLAPRRSAAGWRIYGPAEMDRARKIVALRQLGMGLARITDVMAGSGDDLSTALASHHADLAQQLDRITETFQSVEAARRGVMSAAEADEGAAVSLQLPWPWGGERFDLPVIKPITYITGPLGSGKTRLARAIAEAIPNATFIDLERLTGTGEAMENDPERKARVDAHLRQFAGPGIDPPPALSALVRAIEACDAAILVIDMVEQGLHDETQKALRRYLRSRSFGGRPLFLLTRSSSILDCSDVSTGESIIYCPADHDVPMVVEPRKGAPGYEAVATCLATPAVRARTEGVIAWRPNVV
ncbi:MerR family transcriptional regulator [Shinella sp.]|uniref:MerR family transcriptional regulator n=1 Tax=Shinella sp. TaxID=1870904 RepID=UPI0028A03A2E|nr:MerR family transcriptional regulator [Shinella sp.]